MQDNFRENNFVESRFGVRYFLPYKIYIYSVGVSALLRKCVLRAGRAARVLFLSAIFTLATSTCNQAMCGLFHNANNTKLHWITEFNILYTNRILQLINLMSILLYKMRIYTTKQCVLMPHVNKRTINQTVYRC